MTENIEILTKVYGFTNQIKVCLSLNDIAGVWKTINDLSDYLVSIDTTPPQENILIKLSGFSTGAYRNLGDKIILLSASGDFVLTAGDTIQIPKNTPKAE